MSNEGELDKFLYGDGKNIKNFWKFNLFLKFFIFSIEFSNLDSKTAEESAKVNENEDDFEEEEDEDDYEIILDSSKLPASNSQPSDINK